LGNLRNLVSFSTELRTAGTTNGNATILAQPLFNEKVAFPSLERLFIWDLPMIKEIWTYKQPLPEPGKEAESFYKLSYIHVYGCEQLVYVFPFYILRQLQHLEELSVLHCTKLEVIVSKELKEKEVIHNDIVLPQLKTVELQWLPNLKRICSDTQVFFSDKHAFPALEDIYLTDELEFLRNGTSTKEEECGTSGKGNDRNGEED